MAPKRINPAQVSAPAPVAAPVAAPSVETATPTPPAKRGRSSKTVTEPIVAPPPPVVEPVKETATTPEAKTTNTLPRIGNRRIPRAVREHMVENLDLVMESLIPIFRNARRPHNIPPDQYTPPTPPNVKEVARVAYDELKEIRSSLRVRVQRPEGYERKTSLFNLFVRDMMKEMKDNGVVFSSTTERMKECGRLWMEHKESTKTKA